MAIFNATTTVGQCFTEDYGTVKLDWSFTASYFDNLETNSNVTVKIKYIKIIRQYTGTDTIPSPGLEDRITILDSSYQYTGIDRTTVNGLEGYWNDRDLRLPASCASDSTKYSIKYRISMFVDITYNDPDSPPSGVVSGLQEIFANEFGESAGTVGDMEIDIPCCRCSDEGGGEGEGEGADSDLDESVAAWSACSGENLWDGTTGSANDPPVACPENCDNLCWSIPSSVLNIWMDGYFENPLSGEASFDLNYCLGDRCAYGIGDASIYITLPVGVEIIRIQPNNILNSTDIDFEKAFASGLYLGRWKIVNSPEAGNKERLLPPTYGTFGTIFINKPLGANRTICFDEKATSIEVIPQDADGDASTAVEYNAAGNIANRDNTIVYQDPAENEIHRPIDSYLSPPVWQTGPCWTPCIDEVPIGYSDYYFNAEPFDSNTIDIEYCLTSGDIDTFILPIIFTDYKTSVISIDRDFGDAIEKGWDVQFKSLNPGFSIIYGHGETPISPLGFSTLLRIYLDNSIIKQKPDVITNAIVTFPLFMKLGNSVYKILSQYISEVDTVPYRNLIDPVKSAQAIFAPGEATPGSVSDDYISDGSIMPYDYARDISEGNVAYFFYYYGDQPEAGLLADLQITSTIYDKRFLEIYHYIADSFELVIKEHSRVYFASETPVWNAHGTEFGPDYEILKDNALKSVHYFKTIGVTWAAFIRAFSVGAASWDFTWDNFHTQMLERLCQENITYKLFCKKSDAGLSDYDQVEIVVYYNFPMASASGLEINFGNLGQWLTDNPTSSIVEGDSWGGGLREKNFLQAYSKTTSKFAAVYGAEAHSGAQSSNNPYLTNEPGKLQPEILTTIVIGVTGSVEDAFYPDDPNAPDDCLHDIDSDGVEQGGFNTVGLPAGLAGTPWEDIALALDKDILTARIVTNQNVITRPTSDQWTGNAYSVSEGDAIDIKDCLTSLMLAIEPSDVDLTATHIEETIKLPTSALVAGTESTYKSVQGYYALEGLDLSGITYNPSSWVDSVSGNHMLATIDANNDGIIDIFDVVAIRNLWTALDQYPVDVEVRKLNVVPSSLCVPFKTDVTLYQPDKCSAFSVKPKCFSRVWLSDVITINDEKNPIKYLIEVSYSVDALDANNNFIEDFSGIQFRVEGLGGDGIVGTENGSGTLAGVDATSIRAYQWNENILSSAQDSLTKNTYFAFSTNGKYIPTGKGVLCYLSINPESLPKSLEWACQDSIQDFIVTNKYKRFETTEGVRISHPLSHLKFKSHHTDELLIYESIGLRVSDAKITANRSLDMDILVAGATAGDYTSIITDAATGWTGDSNADSIIDVTDLNYVLGIAARKEYDVKFDSTGSGSIDIADIQAINHYVNNSGFDFVFGATTTTEITPQDCPSNVALMLHFNTDEDSKPVDSSINVLTAIYENNTGLKPSSPAHFPRQSSVYFSGSGTQYAGNSVDITYPSSLILDGAFTIDFWFRMDDVSVNNQTLLSRSTSMWLGSHSSFVIRWSLIYGGSFTLTSHVNSTETNVGWFIGTQVGGITNDTWYHMAITRDSSNDIRMFVNGVAMINPSSYNNATSFDWGGSMRLGRQDGGQGNSIQYPFKGYIDDFRIVKGSAEWTADFSTDFASNPVGPHCPDIVTVSPPGPIGTNLVPAYCCLCTDAEVPALTIIDYNTDSKEVSVVGKRSTREITLSGSEFGCHSGMKHTGGVGLYWNPVDGADYYIVYRKSDDEPAIAIIGAGPGAKELLTSFDLSNSGGPKLPVQILPTLWIDYPPMLDETCKDYVTGDEVSTCTLSLCDIHLSDPYCVDLACPDNYSALIHFNAITPSSTAVVDSGPHGIQATLHPTGGALVPATLDLSVAKFGSSSCSFDGDDDHMVIYAASAPTTMDLDADFTIDFWVRFQDSSGSTVPLSNPKTLFSSFNPNDTSGGADHGIALENVDGQGNYLIRADAGITGASIYIPQTAVSTLNLTDWFHFAVIRSSGVINLYVNGTKGTTGVANTYTFNQRSGVGMLFGAPTTYTASGYSPGTNFEGNIDELRVVKGQALWTDDFSAISGTNSVPLKETVCSCEVASENDIVVPAGIISAEVLAPVVANPNIHTAEQFEYWVVAVNKCSEIDSPKETASVINCKFGPTTENFSFEVALNEEHEGEFKASYHYSARPLGECAESSSDCIPLWTYVQNSNTGNGKEGLSDQGGSIKIASRMPTVASLAGRDEISFTYQPKEDFVGKDTFKYTATVLNPELKQKPSLWCKSESVVTVYVQPSIPTVAGDSGDCTTADESSVILSWDAVDGAENYKVYKGATGALIETISSTGNSTYTYKTLVSEWADWNTGLSPAACAAGATLAASYSVSSYYTSDGIVIESAKSNISVDMQCCLSIQSPTIDINFVQELVNELPTNDEACPPSNYALLIHFDENGQTGPPVDSSSNAITCAYNGGAGLSATGPSHFSIKSSCYFDGAGDYVSVADDSALDLIGDFTIDFWVRFDDVDNNACFFSSADIDVNATIGCELKYLGSSKTWYFSQNSGDGTESTYGCGVWTYIPTNDVWYHVALVRDFSTGNTLYINGVKISHQPYCYGSSTFMYDHNNNGIDIGRSRQSSSTFLKGYIDEFRIVAGAQAWTSDFSEEFAETPPSLYCPDTSSSATPTIKIRKSTITWDDLSFVDTYKIYRRGPYKSGEATGDWKLVTTVTVDPIDGAHSYIDLVDECFGCTGSPSLYDYYVTSFNEIDGESEAEQNTTQISVVCTEVSPIAHNKTYITPHDTNIVNGKLPTTLPHSSIISYSLISTPSAASGVLFDTSNIINDGLWSFNPDIDFAGVASFQWQVLDTCGNSDTGTTTIVVDSESVDPFLILDKEELAALLGQLQPAPGQLGNIHSASALRGRGNAYIVSKSKVDLPEED